MDGGGLKSDWKAVFPPVAAAVTAIDILPEPDATMLQKSAANNAYLLAIFRMGFAVDATHRPHITMIQRFVRTADLDQVYAAAGPVLSRANVTGMRLEAFKYDDVPNNDLGVAGIVAKPTPELLKLRADLIAAAFVPKASGEHFNPDVTTGVAPREYLDKLLAVPFATFTFSPAGAAVYQLGPFGTAAKKLKEWDLN